MVLSANSVEHALIMLGCYTAGVPVAPISPAYSLISTDHAKLKHAFATVRPKVVFAQAAEPFKRAFDTLRAIDPGLVFVTVDGGEGTTPLSVLTGTAPTAAVDAARDALSHDTVAKYLFKLMDLDSVIRLNAQWTGASHGSLVRGEPDRDRPAYMTVDASWGINFDKWDLNFSVKNAGNNHKVLQQPNIQSVRQAYYMKPRTIGVSLSGTF